MRKTLLLFAFFVAIATILSGCAVPHESAQEPPQVAATMGTADELDDTDSDTLADTQTCTAAQTQPDTLPEWGEETTPPQRENEIQGDYEILAYPSYVAMWTAVGAGGPEEYATGDDHEIFNMKSEEYRKPELAGDKTFNILGHDVVLGYISTIKRLFYNNYEEDYYMRTSDIGLQSVCVNPQTGRIVYYHLLPNKDSTGFFLTRIDPASDADVFIEYARKVLSETTGLSTEGWAVDIETDIRKSAYFTKDPVYGFCNFCDKDPNFEAIYTIRFYRTLGGACCDDNVLVEMRNTGEVLTVKACVYEEAFAPFMECHIDPILLEELGYSLYRTAVGRQNQNATPVAHKLTYLAIPYQGDLYVKIKLDYLFRNAAGTLYSGGGEYVYLVARRIDSTP